MRKLVFASLVAAATLLLLSPSSSAASPTPTPTVAPAERADQAKYGIYPIAWREIITRWLETQLLDAASAKIEWLGEPKPIEIKGRDGLPFFGYVVDFKVNSRNKFGMYTGFQTRRVYIRNGEVAGGGRRRS